MWSYKQKLSLKKNPISRVYTSKISVAYYTMGIITFVTFLFRSKFGTSRYQELVPLEESRIKYFSVSMISNVKRYDLVGISWIYFFSYHYYSNLFNQNQSVNFWYLLSFLIISSKGTDVTKPFFVSNKFVPSLHDNKITIYKLIAQLYLIFRVGALK